VELSWAVTVKEYAPATVGVPDMIPAPDKDMPIGRLPVVIEKVYGAIPPVTVRV